MEAIELNKEQLLNHIEESSNLIISYLKESEIV